MSSKSKRKQNLSINNELPEGWIAKKSSTYNRYYYFNEKTGATTWTKPGNSNGNEGSSSNKAESLRTGATQVVRTVRGTVPNPLLLLGSSTQGKYQTKLVKTDELPPIKNVTKVTFSVKQIPSLKKPNAIFCNNHNVSKEGSNPKNNESFHNQILGKVMKGNKFKRKAKSLEANFSSIVAPKGVSCKKIGQSSGNSSNDTKDSDVVHIESKPGWNMSTREKDNINVASRPRSERRSTPNLKTLGDMAHNQPITSVTPSRVNFTQDELVRRYDRTHPCKESKSKKEGICQFTTTKEAGYKCRKRLHEQRTSDLIISTTASLPNENEETNMEWADIEDEKVLLNIQEHRQQFQEIRNTDFDSPPVDMEVQYFDLSASENKECVIVLDTNILISHVIFVRQISENEFQGVGHPTLVIPWMVLKELDAMKGKSHGKMSVLARNARCGIQFINQCFNLHHPYVKGQSAIDDKEECFKVEGPDDSILNCCLQLRNKNKQVLLLSNDVNLRNKALANGIKSFSKEQFEKEIKSENLGQLFQVENITGKEISHHQKNTAIEKSSSTVPKKQNEQPRNAILYSEFKNTLQRFLSKLLETEMKNAFEDMWLKVVYLKPPWSLLDVLKCLSKHWCAVFCFVIDSKAKDNIEELITFFKRPFSGESLRDIENMIKSAISLCKAVTSRNYSDMASEYENHFQAFLRKEDDIPESVNSESPSQVTLSTLPSSNPPDDSGLNVVFEVFQMALSLVNTFCGILCDVLGVSSGIIYDKPEILVSLEELKERLPNVNKFVEDLTSSMRSVLEVPECYLTLQHPALLTLRASLLAVIPPDNPLIGAITCEKLQLFAVKASTRLMLSNGLNQFTQYQMLLLKVINFNIDR